MNRLRNRVSALERSGNREENWLWFVVPPGTSTHRKRKIEQMFAAQLELPKGYQCDVSERYECTEPTILNAGNISKLFEHVANHGKRISNKGDSDE